MAQGFVANRGGGIGGDNGKWQELRMQALRGEVPKGVLPDPAVMAVAGIGVHDMPCTRATQRECKAEMGPSTRGVFTPQDPGL